MSVEVILCQTCGQTKPRGHGCPTNPLPPNRGIPTGPDGKPCPDCDVPLMLALSPLHPKRYAELACATHRNAFGLNGGSS